MGGGFVADGERVGAGGYGPVAAFDPADARALADSLEPGTAVAFLLVGHHWAAPLFDAITETGGMLIGGFPDLRGRALITAGLVEEAAAHEAVTALTAAGLIVAAADQAAADAVAEDVAAVEAADEVAAEPWKNPLPSSPLLRYRRRAGHLPVGSQGSSGTSL